MIGQIMSIIFKMDQTDYSLSVKRVCSKMILPVGVRGNSGLTSQPNTYFPITVPRGCNTMQTVVEFLILLWVIATIAFFALAVLQEKPPVVLRSSSLVYLHRITHPSHTVLHPLTSGWERSLNLLTEKRKRQKCLTTRYLFETNDEKDVGTKAELLTALCWLWRQQIKTSSCCKWWHMTSFITLVARVLQAIAKVSFFVSIFIKKRQPVRAKLLLLQHFLRWSLYQQLSLWWIFATFGFLCFLLFQQQKKIRLNNPAAFFLLCIY